MEISVKLIQKDNSEVLYMKNSYASHKSALRSLGNIGYTGGIISHGIIWDDGFGRTYRMCVIGEIDLRFRIVTLRSHFVNEYNDQTIQNILEQNNPDYGWATPFIKERMSEITSLRKGDSCCFPAGISSVVFIQKTS